MPLFLALWMLVINRLFREWDNGLLCQMVEWRSVFLIFRLLRRGCHSSFLCFPQLVASFSSIVFSYFWKFWSGRVIFPDSSAFSLVSCKELLLNRSCFCPNLKSSKLCLQKLSLGEPIKKSVKNGYTKAKRWVFCSESWASRMNATDGWMLCSTELMCCAHKGICRQAFSMGTFVS